MLYPVLNEARALLDLGGVWRFETAGCDSYDPARCGVRLDHAMTMAVPASYNDQKDDCNLRAHYGFVLYQTTFTLPRALQNERIVLRFGAVTHAAEVYLNGVLLGAHKGGFLPFEFEVQNVIQSSENLLTVAVDNRVNYSTLPVYISDSYNDLNFGYAAAATIVGGTFIVAIMLLLELILNSKLFGKRNRNADHT